MKDLLDSIGLLVENWIEIVAKMSSLGFIIDESKWEVRVCYCIGTTEGILGIKDKATLSGW